MLTAVCRECEKSISTKFDQTIPKEKVESFYLCCSLKEKDGRPIECRYVRECPLNNNN